MDEQEAWCITIRGTVPIKDIVRMNDANESTH